MYLLLVDVMDKSYEDKTALRHDLSSSTIFQIYIFGLFQVGEFKSKSKCTPVQSLAFAKTHKAGSTTLQNIILRYGYLRDLTFAIPAWKGWMFDQTRSFNASTLVRRYVNNPGLKFVKE